MHIHNVYFWLRDGLGDQAEASFEHGLEILSADHLILHCYYGKPAGTHRDVVENSYTYGLVFVFEDKAAHNRYQEGAVHQHFLENHSQKWQKVVVYDIESS